MRELTASTAWTTQEVLRYLDDHEIGIAVGKGGARLVKPPHMAVWAFTKHSRIALPHLKVRREAIVTHFERQAELSLPAAERRGKLFAFHLNRLAHYRAELPGCTLGLAWFSAYTRLTGWVDVERDAGYPKDATRACLAGLAVITGTPVELYSRELPGSTFPDEWKGTKPGVWHVARHVALSLPAGCIPPADYQPPKYVADERRKELAKKWMRARYGKDELRWKDRENQLPD